MSTARPAVQPPPVRMRTTPPLARRMCRASRLLRKGSRRLVLVASRYGLGKGPLAGWPTGKALLTSVRWGSREGALALVERHLIFRWHGPGIDYAFGLRAWEPLPEAIARSVAIVLSMPR